MKRHVIIWVGLIVCATVSICGGSRIQAAMASESVITLNSAKSFVPVDHGVFYYIENSPVSIAQAVHLDASKWRAASEKNLNFGACPDPVWLRFDLHNGDDRTMRWYMEIRWRSLDHVAVFLQHHLSAQNNEIPYTSGLVTLHQDAVAHRNYVYPFSVPANTSVTIFMRLYSSTKLIVPIKLWQKEPLRQNTVVHLILLGIFLGILAVMAFYNLLLYLPTRDQIFLYFSFFVFSLIVYALMASGLGMRYLWGEVHWIQQRGYGVGSSLSYLTGAILIRRYLRLEQYGGWILRINTAFILYWLAGFCLYLFYSSPALVLFQDLAAFLSTIVGMATALYCWAKKDDSARLFSIAWIVLTVSTVLIILSILGIFGSIFISMLIQLSGFAIVVALLSFALLERINRERAARSAAQQEALVLSQKIADERAEKLKAHRRALELERRTSAELEKRVQTRTTELETIMQSLEAANQEMAYLSVTDSLTKLNNRRYFDQALLDHFTQAQRTGQYLAVALGDIDHFKVINDTYGHLIGDECLALVAQTIQEQMNAITALTARYGGEEFAIVMMVSEPQQACQVAETVRMAIEKRPFVDRGNTIDLRISIGVAAWIPKTGESAQNMVQAADQALYRAKQAGRNQVVLDDGESN